jgi:hypothetical protein
MELRNIKLESLKLYFADLMYAFLPNSDAVERQAYEEDRYREQRFKKWREKRAARIVAEQKDERYREFSEYCIERARLADAADRMIGEGAKVRKAEAEAEARKAKAEAEAAKTRIPQRLEPTSSREKSMDHTLHELSIKVMSGSATAEERALFIRLADKRKKKQS